MGDCSTSTAYIRPHFKNQNRERWLREHCSISFSVAMKQPNSTSDVRTWKTTSPQLCNHHQSWSQHWFTNSPYPNWSSRLSPTPLLFCRKREHRFGNLPSLFPPCFLFLFQIWIPKVFGRSHSMIMNKHMCKNTSFLFTGRWIGHRKIQAMKRETKIYLTNPRRIRWRPVFSFYCKRPLFGLSFVGRKAK